MNDKTRICPKCKSIVKYKTGGHRNFAERRNALCRKCQIKHQKHIPNTECEVCKKEIYRRPSDRLQEHSNFCSTSCRNKYYSKENSFMWKGGKKVSALKNRAQDKRRKLDRKIKAVSIMGGKCELCGYNKCIASLDFHHKNPMEKEATLKELWVKKWSYIENEIKKCQLLCSNCHRELHWKEYHG